MTKPTSTAKSFVLYKDFHDQLKELTAEQAGHLLKAIYAFQLDDEYSVTDPLVKFALKGFVSQFKRDNDKYAETCSKRSVSGTKGAKQKLANAGKRKHKVANQAESESVSESVSDIDISREREGESRIINNNSQILHKPEQAVLVQIKSKDDFFQHDVTSLFCSIAGEKSGAGMGWMSKQLKALASRTDDARACAIFREELLRMWSEIKQGEIVERPGAAMVERFKKLMGRHGGIAK